MFKPGDKIKIRGNPAWYTELLDGEMATVLKVTPVDYKVRVKGLTWYIAKEDALEVEDE